jgi:ABC-type bacteriocin/lantibiotic exporter with double-glycine peptidase domain
MPGRIIEVFAVAGLFILIAIAQWSGHTDSATLVTIGAFMAAAYKIIPGLVKVINLSGQIKAYEFSATDLVSRPSSNKKQYPGFLKINSVEAKDLSFSFNQLPVIHHLSFCVRAGEFIGITGASGKGKTTLLNLLLGFLEPASGSISINNNILDREGLNQCWPGISYVRQQPFFIYDTLEKNITLEENTSDKTKLDRVVSITGITALLADSQEGLDKMITENGKNISGGQQQRIAIARALYKKADMILLDEPFNELDESSVICLLEHFRKLSTQGKLVMMITHDKKSLAYCSKIISLDNP